jgi:hypothetical protein
LRGQGGGGRVHLDESFGLRANGSHPHKVESSREQTKPKYVREICSTYFGKNMSKIFGPNIFHNLFFIHQRKLIYPNDCQLVQNVHQHFRNKNTKSAFVVNSKAVISLAHRRIYQYPEDGCKGFFVRGCFFAYSCRGILFLLAWKMDTHCKMTILFHVSIKKLSVHK